MAAIDENLYDKLNPEDEQKVDIPEKRAKKAAEAYAMQISWRNIIVLEEYPSFRGITIPSFIPILFSTAAGSRMAG
ncbi:MAG: hypothetical protein K6C06_08365 [Lachnospiraceae bacterium]|nr:hypothetical protein [Lachnospiraceae bacterium]